LKTVPRQTLVLRQLRSFTSVPVEDVSQGGFEEGGRISVGGKARRESLLGTFNDRKEMDVQTLEITGG
jgi:hypothetical protein